jgi:regulator of replication initiation timing
MSSPDTTNPPAPADRPPVPPHPGLRTALKSLLAPSPPPNLGDHVPNFGFAPEQYRQPLYELNEIAGRASHNSRGPAIKWALNMLSRFYNSKEADLFNMMEIADQGKQALVENRRLALENSKLLDEQIFSKSQKDQARATVAHLEAIIEEQKGTLHADTGHIRHLRKRIEALQEERRLLRAELRKLKAGERNTPVEISTQQNVKKMVRALIDAGWTPPGEE